MQWQMKPDVIILGGGPNGLAAALSLGGRGLARPLNVLLLDARNPREIPPDSRGTALTLATQNMLKALGAWEGIAPHTAEMRDVMVTDGWSSHDQRPTLLGFSTEGRAPAAACIVENRYLAEGLLTSVDASPCITLQGGFAFEGLAASAGHITVKSTSGETTSAALLVAADGRNSRVRQALGIEVMTQDYGQKALSFAIAHDLSHDNVAEEHFSPEGVFAVLPLPGNRSSIVWGMTPAKAGELMALDVEAFNARLQAQMGTRLGTPRVDGPRGAFPLVKLIAKQFAHSRTVLVGDAAHAIHPLAGLGLNLGFKDAAALADVVARAFARGQDIGGASVLEDYEIARRFDTTLTSLAMDGMNALFVNDNPVLKLLRGAGLKAVDRLPAAKSMLMGQAAGLSQNNPRLMQGLQPG